MLVVGAYVARRWDCASEAEIKVSLPLEPVQRTFHVRTICPHSKAHNWTCSYVLLHAPIQLLKDREYTIQVTVSGKDLKFWAGFYGARIGHIFARTFNHKE